MLIKTSGIDPLRYYDIFEILSLPRGTDGTEFTELQFSVLPASVEKKRPGLIISGDKSKGQDKNFIRTKTYLVPRIYPAGFYMCFTPAARGSEYSNSVPAGTEFQNDHECEARGIHFSLGPSEHEGSKYYSS